MRKYIILYIALCLQVAARGQTIADIDLSGLPQPTTAKALRYWIDDDIGSVQTTDILNGLHTVDVSSLLDGLHTIHYQIIDSEDKVAAPYSGIFLKMDSNLSSTSASTLRYWFDSNTEVYTCDANAGTQVLDVSSLLDGLHTIHYQVVDTEGAASYIASGIFLKMDSNLSSTTASTLRYWFDSDTNVSTCDANAGVQLLDVSMLLDGLHTLHYQVVDTEGQASYIASDIFLKMQDMAGNGNVTAEKLVYWFDDETTITTIDMASGIMTLDASDLLDGLHTVHYLVQCSDGSVTSAYSSIFLRMNIDILSTKAQSLRYWFDTDTEVTTAEIAQGVQTIDASHLLDGLHTVHYQIVDDSGAVTAPVSGIFLKMAEGIKTTTAQSLRYWFDKDTDVRTTSVAGGSQTIDVSDLLPGLHFLHYQLVDSEGQLASPMSGIFLKMFDKPYEEGQNGITKYQYWLNDNSATIRTVTLDAAANPYTLIALLPMQKEPIRSSCFHFETKGSKPMMYAKNDFHIRFTDTAGYFKDDSRQFIDYSISREVEPVDGLQGTQTFPKVAANDVRWYTMEVAPGDTAAFKLSQPATIQVFAPSGTEVFKTSESASVKWGGIHTWENGTYYLAVHDVTGSQSTMKLEYMHMDKYDVVDWDVHTVGNGGCSTITFKGNGFRDLYAVDLVVAPGDTIHSVYVSHDSDAETSVTFDFTAATLGDYNAVFHFTEEDKPVANVVTIEEAIGIELATDVSFPSSFLSGTSTTYTIKITNKGNMTAYNVPIYIFISNTTKGGISHISLKGLDLDNLSKSITDYEGWTETEILSFKEKCDRIGEDHYFLRVKTIDEDTGDSIWGRYGVFFTELPQKQTKVITLSVTTVEHIEAWISVPTEWESTYFSEGERRKVPCRKNALKDWFCCHHEKIECITGLVSNAADFAGLFPMLPASTAIGVGGCISGLVNQISDVSSQIFCSDDSPHSVPGNQLKDIAKGISWYSWILSCLNNFVPGGQAKQIISEIVAVGDLPGFMQSLVGVSGSCRTAWSKKKPNCPPDPPHGGDSTPQPPSDPNDIYGYLSEAGSKFIADSVARVNYTIEFENDTTFATAAAHTIVIKDTLDSKYFDLTKFLPTGVRIGGHETFLDEADVVTSNNKTTFVKTIDMRPEINAIAQVEGEYNQKKGIAEWRFTSLDPMTMEPTDELMQGILPVNYNGTSGIGEVMFEIGMKQGKADGTQIKNRAGIVFDYEEAILTPTWTNIVDAVPPSSVIGDFWMVNDSTLRVFADAEDARSGVWKYVWYVQAGENAPWWKEGETERASFDYRFYEGIDYGFCVLAVDSAGNVEQKVIQRERGFKTYGPDYEDKISPIQTSPEKGEAYDLSGRKARRKAKGVLIRNRRKALVKE